jgi:hypothetical protein
LAWTCLECELNPQNVTAQVLKENLKEALNLHAQQSQGLGNGRYMAKTVALNL